MKKLCIWALVLLSGLLTLQAQESEPHAPRILGFECGSGKVSSLDVSGCTSLKKLENVKADTLRIHGKSMDTLTCTGSDFSCSYEIGVLDAAGCTTLRQITCTPYNYGGTIRRLNLQGCTSLTSLSCSSNRLSSLDVSSCTSLAYLFCSDNQLSSLDVSSCTSLAYLFCSDNQLSSLDVSSCTSLAYLSCSNNQLSSLDVSGCTVLTSLYCSQNDLTTLDVSGCTSLKKLENVKADTLRIHGKSMDTLTLCNAFSYDYEYYEIGVLDAAGCTTLRQITCTPYDYYGHIRRLNLQGCTSLTSLDCSYNSLSSLDVSGCTSLASLNCGGNSLSSLDSLDISGCTSLKYLDCSGNNLKDLYIIGNPTIETLDCSDNQLAYLTVSNCTALKNLICSGNRLTNFDMSGCTALSSLYCSNNRLTSLYASGCTALEVLYCNENQLNSLDVRGCESLRKLICWGNQLKKLELGNCRLLDTLGCESNSLERLDLKDMSSLKWLYCGGNSLESMDLSGCVSLKDLSLCTADGQLAFKENAVLTLNGCRVLDSLDCSGFQLKGLDVRGCASLKTLLCSNNRLSSLDVGDCVALTTLSCNTNYIDSLNVEHNTLLSGLDCGNNRLGSLDVSRNTALQTLFCHRNRLDSLDVSRNISLTALKCGNNRLRNLDLSRNTALTSLDCEYNRLPFSVLYKAYSQHSYSRFCALSQSDSIRLTVDSALDLSSERIVGSAISTYNVYRPDSYFYGGWSLAGDDDYREDDFVFRFSKPASYKLELTTAFSPFKDVVFTWFVSAENPVQRFTVQVSSSNAEWGTATITGNGTYEEGTEVTITATSKEGYRFINWTRKDGSVFSTEAVHTFTVSENVELTANFEKLPEDVETFTVAVAANNAEWGRVSQTGDGRYEKDEEVTVTARANAGYRFVDWTKKDGSVFSTEAVHTFAVTENLELTANFKQTVGNESREDDNFYVYVQEHTIHLSAERGEVQVYNAAGVCVYRGWATVIPVKSSGLYIVRVGERTYKAMVR